MFFGRLLAVFVGFILFILLIAVIFGHGGKKPVTNPIQPLPSYADSDATVSFTTQGIVNADSLHRSIRITVSNSQAEVDVLAGYNPTVVMSKTFENNTEAYSVFLKSINNAGFLAKSKDPKIPASEDGQCALGFRYILALNQDGTDLSRTWASTCGRKVGNSTGAVSTIRQLFENQIPGYDSLVSNVNLSATSPNTNSL